MRAGQASLTARRVAAYRLHFDRLPAPFGDAAADDRLSRDVAGAEPFAADPAMARYLRGRTRFVDAAVCTALAAGIRQVVTVGAGYDGRALRYARPGVRWFELDHPETARDKQRRLESLHIDCRHIAFAELDLARLSAVPDALARALRNSGHDSAEPSLVVCEGVVMYLSEDQVAALLRALREVVPDGSRLALTLSVAVTTAAARAGRARLRRVVRVAGEPLRNSMTALAAAPLLAAGGWQPWTVSEPALRAGFVLAVPAQKNTGISAGREI